MGEPLSKDAFEIYLREHQLHLDSKFDKLAGCIESVKDAREKAWGKHAEECAACRDCSDEKRKKTDLRVTRLQKFVIVGCVVAALVGAALSPYLGFNHLVGFVIKLLTGIAPVGL